MNQNQEESPYDLLYMQQIDQLQQYQSKKKLKYENFIKQKQIQKLNKQSKAQKTPQNFNKQKNLEQPSTPHNTTQFINQTGCDPYIDSYDQYILDQKLDQQDDNFGSMQKKDLMQEKIQRQLSSDKIVKKNRRLSQEYEEIDNIIDEAQVNNNQKELVNIIQDLVNKLKEKKSIVQKLQQEYEQKQQDNNKIVNL